LGMLAPSPESAVIGVISIYHDDTRGRQYAADDDAESDAHARSSTGHSLLHHESPAAEMRQNLYTKWFGAGTATRPNERVGATVLRIDTRGPVGVGLGEMTSCLRWFLNRFAARSHSASARRRGRSRARSSSALRRARCAGPTCT